MFGDPRQYAKLEGHSLDEAMATRKLLIAQMVICAPKTGPFKARVFRIFPWLGGAQDDEGITVLGRPEGVSGREPMAFRLPTSAGRRNQPGDLFQLEEEIRGPAAA
jgi:hypothetical protein